MAEINILKSIAEDFIKQKENHILYLSLSTDSMEKVSAFLNKNKIVLDLKNNYEPLKPYMEIVKEKNPSEKIIEENTYSLQRQMFKNYFSNGYCGKRNDALLLEEIFYESKRCKESVIALTEKLIDDIVIIFNAQEMGKESIEITKALEKSNLFKGKIIFCFNYFSLSDASIEINEWLEEIYNYKNFFEILNAGEEKSSDSKEEITSLPSFNFLLHAMENAVQFTSFSQGKSISNFITANLDNLLLTSEETTLLYLEMAKCCFYAGDSDSATLYLNYVTENEKDEFLLGRAYYYLGNTLIYKNAYVQAQKYYNLGLMVLDKLKDSALYALIYANIYRMTDRNGNGNAVEQYKKAQELLSEKGLLNNSVNISLVMPWELISSPEKRHLLTENIEAAIKYAKEIDNLFALSTAYHWKGILLSRMGYVDQALDWYQKCSDIRAENCELASLVKIRNGLSYEYLIRSDYEKAYGYINSFISRIEEINDYSEVIITLKNVSHTLLYSRHFAESEILFTKMLKLMRLFKLGEITFNAFLPEINDLLVYNAFISSCRGDITPVRIAFHNVKNNGKNISHPAKSFLIYLEAILELTDKNYEHSEKLFKEAVDKTREIGCEQNHHVCFLYYEYALALRKNGLEEKALSYAGEGNKIAHEKNLSFYSFDSSDDLIELYLKNVKPFEKLNIDLNILESNAQKAQLLNQLHKKLRDSQFLNKITSLGATSKEESKYATNVVAAIFDHTMADAVYIAEHTNGWNILAGISKNETAIPDTSVWTELFKESQKKNHEHLFMTSNRKMIFADISKYEFMGAIIIVTSEQTSFTPEDSSILNIAISNLQAQLVMIKQNKNLLFISSTDQLSMLNNRRALQEKIAVDSEMTRRYQFKKNVKFQLTITFMDLDNFKYYNDTFGHEAGDLLIMKFSALLKQVYRRVDFVSRFGGDEFVILLPNTNCDEAKRAAERVREELEKQHHFIADLEEMIGKSLGIPQNKYLGFSTGLCCNQDIDDASNLERVMINADHALYFAKHHQKGSIVSWANVKEKIANEIEGSGAKE